MKIAKRTIKSLLLTAMLLLATFTTLQAQVTMGSNIKTTRAALLELKTQQTAGTVPTVTDDANITSTTGGLLLPRVKLKNVNTMEPFIADDNTDWLANTSSIKEKLAGLMVYNLTNDGTFYPAVYTWDGSSWTTSQANPAVSFIKNQPEPFTFYETGLGTAAGLKMTVEGPGTWTYKWYQVTGKCIHVRIGAPVGTAGTIYTTPAAANAAGANTSEFKPQAILKGTTFNGNNTGFYKFYCVAESSQGAKLTSDIAEVAVGCGAKDNLGEWVSFMCFNLGAIEHTIYAQINHTLTFSKPNDSDGQHYYIAGEEQVYGDLYQWGRIGDGHEKRGQAQGFVPGSKNPGTNQIGYGTGPEFEDGNTLAATRAYPWRQVKRGTSHYGKFITTATAQRFNWAHSLPASQIDQLWRTTRFGPNDPCTKFQADGNMLTYYPPTHPTSTAGGAANTAWRTPTQDEWGSIFRGGGISGGRASATANTWVWNPSNGGGMEIKPDGKKTTLFLPASGYRNYGSGLLYYQGSHGIYWSSVVHGTNAYNMVFNYSAVQPATNYARGYGLALRCIKN